MPSSPKRVSYRAPLPTVVLLRSTISPALRALWRPRMEGAETRPEGACFVYGNHSNYLDAFTTNLFLGRDLTAGIMTHEFLKKGLFARLMHNVGILPTRPDRMEPHLIREVYRLLEHDRSILIYPEGGRRWDGLPMPWVSTITRLFIRAQVPLHPVVIDGSYVAWPRWAKYPRPARLKVRFLPPVRLPADLPYPEALARLAGPFMMDESRPPEDVKPKRAFRPADGIETILYRNPFTGEPADIFTPDGRRVLSRRGTHAWRMLPDSSLVDDRTGDVLTVADLYPKVRAAPLRPDGDGSILKRQVKFLLEDPTDGHMRRCGTVTAQLFDDALRITGTSEQWHLPLESVRSIAVQRNWKLQLGLPAGLHQLNFNRGGSPLEWEDAIRKLQGDA